MEQNFCQSCAMPMGEADDLYGTTSDGGKSAEYCSYCFQNGVFTSDASMEEMIEICVPHMTAAHPEMSEDKARSMMQQFFPMLKRWKKG